MNKNTKKIIIVLSLLIVIGLFVFILRMNNLSTENQTTQENINDGDLMNEENEMNNTIMSNIVVLETTKGNIEIELDFEKAPITSENFKNYVLSGHFNGLIFHRVIKGFMVQGGGFKSDGSQRETNNPIVLESDNGLSNETGTIAMARTNDPDSATSQFFINTVDNDFLDYSSGNPGYAVFGKVIDGMDVVYKIEETETTVKNGHQDWPKEEILIIRAYVKEQHGM